MRVLKVLEIASFFHGGGMVRKGNGRTVLPSGTSGAILFSPAVGHGSQPLAALLSREQECRVTAWGQDSNIWALHAEKLILFSQFSTIIAFSSRSKHL